MEFIQIIQLTKEFPEYGTLIFFGAVLFLLKQYLNLLKDFVGSIRGIKSSIHKTPKNIEAMASAEASASKEMKAIAIDYGADRVGISLFHNGTHSLQNVHFLKTSVMVEGLSGRVGGVLSVSQNRLVAEYGDLGDRIIVNKEHIAVPDIDTMNEDLKGFSDFLRIHFVKSLYLLPLFVEKDGKRVVDGCLYVHHCTEARVLDDTQLAEIQARAQAVYNELSKSNGVSE